MGLIKEPLNVDFVVDPRPVTKKEEEAISNFIKMEREKKAAKRKRSLKRKTKQKVAR